MRNNLSQCRKSDWGIQLSDLMSTSDIRIWQWNNNYIHVHMYVQPVHVLVYHSYGNTFPIKE